MKKQLLLITLLPATLLSLAQPPKKAEKEKPPTQKEMEAMMKEAEKMMGDMSPEDKKMMDSMGIKMPDFKKTAKSVSGVTDKQLATAWEDENRIVPKKDDARIAAISGAVNDATMSAYITAIQSKAATLVKPEIKNVGEKVYSYIRQKSRNSREAGNMATGLWIAGKPEIACYVLGKICTEGPVNTDNLSNYASMLTMLDAQQLAIPILNNLNAKFPRNSTLLNNLGQAWFGLGEITKAEKYIDSAIAIYAYHPQANMTKAAIEESHGNTVKAREAVKRSIRHAYTDEKSEKLKKLGEKLSADHFRLPKRSKADPMNLGSFTAPDFPFSVEACLVAEKEWNAFYAQLNEKAEQLKQLREQALERAAKGQEQRMKADVALVNAAMANPGTKGQFISVPMYAGQAGLKLTAYTDLYRKKLEEYSKRGAGFNKGERSSLKEAYDKEMDRLREEDNEQTGEGKPNKDYCPKYRETTDKYLKAVNTQLLDFYAEALKIQKEFLNESAYWQLYIQWPDMYEAVKLGYQLDWLGTLKNGLGMSGGYGYPFVSITQYVCKKEEKDGKKSKLQKFDDVACQYNDTMDLSIIKFTNNCSRMTSEFDLTFIKYVRKDDFERAEGDTYTGSTIKISAEEGVSATAGPVKLEAKVGVGLEFEFDRNGVKDVVLIGEAKVGAGTGILDEYKGKVEENGKFDRDGIGIAGKDAFPTTVEAGVEGRISIITGKGSVEGSGVLKGVKITKW